MVRRRLWKCLSIAAVLLTSVTCAPDPQLPEVPINGGHTAVLFTRITLSRSACFGSCPVYQVTFTLDGAALYEGIAHVEKIGTSVGNVGPDVFERLALYAERSNFMGLKDRYEADVTDSATATVTIQARSGEIKTVSDYGGVGPLELWMLQQAIDGVAARVGWK